MRMGKEGAMNRAEAHEPHDSRREKPADAGGNRHDHVGNETKAKTRAATTTQEPTQGLGGAVKELRSQHPIAHDDHGPHHGPKHHHRVA